MAISEDLRSVQTILGAMLTGNTMEAGASCSAEIGGAHVVRLLCDNLAALADQVEALEAVPLAPVAAGYGQRFSSYLPGLLSLSSREAPLQ